MNILKPVSNFFFSKEIKCSTDQLKEDFGVFPPSPLKSQSIQSNFIIFRVRGIGEIFNEVQILMKILHIPEADFAVNMLDSAQHRAMKEGLKFGQKTFAEATEKFNQIKISASIQKILFLGISIAMVIKARRTRKKNNIGSFLPLAGSDGRITLRIGASKKGTSIDAVLAHEHIHLLQHRFGLSTTRYLRTPDYLIEEKYKCDSSILYMLEDIEVEARLHEVVLSYYRKTHELPLRKDTFIQALAGCEQISELVKEAIESQGVQLQTDMPLYHAREPAMVEQLDFILYVIKDLDYRYRFITEVLTVMYGNLLKYYGDENSSQIFTEQIERPNLYDTLYL